MFHYEQENVRAQLLKGFFGLEKECLRISPEGNFVHTLHPFSKEEKNIVYDFCENQIEINTEISDSASGAVQELLEHTNHIKEVLAKLDEPELLWPFSNPPCIKNEEDIPMARHVAEAGYPDGYREYLATRYGRYKMSFTGIHINYSFGEELFQADFALSDETDYQEYKNNIYLAVAEGLALYGWIMTVLTAASPLLDGSYIEKGKERTTVFNGMSSSRCSELGYWNFFAPVFDYSDIRSYAKSIQSYVDAGYISAPTELYYPIRLKSPGKNSLEKLHTQGVNHIELRMIDLNPYEEAGLNEMDLEFAKLLIVWLACKEREHLETKDQVQAVQNFKNAAHYDLKTVNILWANSEVESVADAGVRVIEMMKAFYEEFQDERIMGILSFEEEKLLIPEKRYSWMVREEFEAGYVTKGLEFVKG